MESDILEALFLELDKIIEKSQYSIVISARANIAAAIERAPVNPYKIEAREHINQTVNGIITVRYDEKTNSVKITNSRRPSLPFTFPLEDPRMLDKIEELFSAIWEKYNHKVRSERILELSRQARQARQPYKPKI